MRPLFMDTPMINDKNLITVTHRRQSMGNHDHRPAGRNLRQIAHDDMFRLIIQGACRLIKNQYTGIRYEGPGYGNALNQAVFSMLRENSSFTVYSSGNPAPASGSTTSAISYFCN